jgi:hypothetical protein
LSRIIHRRVVEIAEKKQMQPREREKTNRFNRGEHREAREEYSTTDYTGENG